MAEKDKDILENIGEQEYKYGFTTDIETETIGKGLNEEVVRLISAKKGEPAWMTERRVAAYRHWLTLEPPTWAHLTIPNRFQTSSIRRPQAAEKTQFDGRGRP